MKKPRSTRVPEERRALRDGPRPPQGRGAARHEGRGLFITFEGGEGSGKSTQARLLARALKRRGLRVWLTREPGAGPLGRAVRRILLSSRGAAVPPLAELFLYLADRAEHVETLRRALRRFDVVVCDRFHDSTVVYQGYGRGLDRRLIAAAHGAMLAGARPDLTFLLDAPPEAGLRRARARNSRHRRDDEGRFEGEALAFHRRVRRGYLALARREPRRFLIVNGALPRGGVHRRVLHLTEPFLTKGKRHGS